MKNDIFCYLHFFAAISGQFRASNNQTNAPKPPATAQQQFVGECFQPAINGVEDSPIHMNGVNQAATNENLNQASFFRNKITSNAHNQPYDAYQRTLEYVQSCQTWAENSEISSSTHPMSNMTVSDMSTSLSSLLEENRYLELQQMI